MTTGREQEHEQTLTEWRASQENALIAPYQYSARPPAPQPARVGGDET